MAEDFDYPTDQYVLLGKIAKVHGLRGEVKIYSYSGQPENFYDYHEIVLVDSAGNLTVPFDVVKVRVQGKMAITQLSSVTHRNRAEEIVGLGVLVQKHRLPDTAEDEYYWYQYEGKFIQDLAGETIGRVESLFNNGAQDILVVKSEAGEILIPVTKSIIVQETADALIVDPPAGLLDLGHDADD
jgi:16S rRNA processing protein RimM